MDLQLDGRTAFISGSSQGIGYAIAAALAAEGVGVTLNGRDPAKLDAAVATLQRDVPGARVTGRFADFASSDSVDRLIADLGDVDILVNNVGLFDLVEFTDASDAEWLRYFEVNVLSGVRLARAVLPGMLDRGWGRIVFVSSESGVNVPGNMIPYGMSKAAQLAVANGLAKLTKGTGVTVNSILGGPTYSDGVARTVESLAAQQGLPIDRVKGAIEGGLQTSLLARFIEPSEIASTVAYLSSPRASATNGSALRVDGGVLTSVL